MDEDTSLPEVSLDAIGTGDDDGEGDIAAQIVAERGKQLGDLLLDEEGQGDEPDETDSAEDGEEGGGAEADSGDSEEADEPDEDPELDDGSGEPADAALQQARALLKAGKELEALKAAFGEDFDPQSLRPVAKDWVVLRAREEKLAKKLATGSQEMEAGLKQKYDERHQALTEEVQQVVARLRPVATWSQRIEAFKQNGDASQLVAGLEEATGASFQDIQKAFIQGTKVRVDPAVQQMKAQLARQEEVIKKLQAGGQKPEPTPEEQQAAQQAQYQQQLTAFNEHLDEHFGEHKVAKLPKWKDRMLAEIRSTADPRTRKATISYQEAADRLVKRAVAEAKALGLAPAAAPTKTGKKPPKVTGRNGARDSANDNQDDDDGEDALTYVLKERARRRRKAGGA